MSQNKTKLARVLASIFLVAMCFQNCSDDFDISQYQQGVGNSSSITLPPAVDNEPAPVISSQSPSASVVENTNQKLSIEVENLVSYQVQWYKDGAIVANATAVDLNFAPVKLTDAGDYQAVVTAGNVTLQSEVIKLTVTRDPTPQTFTTASVAYGGQNYYLYFANNQTYDKPAVDNFCKYKLGASASAVSYTPSTQQAAIYRYVYASATSACNNNPYVVSYNSNGLCLAYYPNGFALYYMASVTCKPF